MSEMKNVGKTWLAKCNQLPPLPFKGLTHVEGLLYVSKRLSIAGVFLMLVTCAAVVYRPFFDEYRIYF